MPIQVNPYQQRIGSGRGFDARTARGQSVGAYATPASWTHDKDAGTVTLYSDPSQWTTLTPAEARDLADVLRNMADLAEIKSN
jgi:hypothetical protein